MRISLASVIRTILICAVICVFAFFLAMTTRRVYAIFYPPPSLSSLALCFAKSTDPNFSSECLNSTVKDLFAEYSTQELMNYLVGSTTPTVIVNDCHPIGHIVGALTYTKYGSIEGALAQCSNVCRSACTHGVIGAGVLAQMGEEYSDDDIAHADEAKFDKLAKWYCAQSSSICHAIGHLAYIIFQDDAGALGECDKAAPSGWYRESCYQGVFMERAGDFVNELFPSGANKAPDIHLSDYLYPCTSLAETYRHACFLFLNQYQAPVFAANGLTSKSQQLTKAAQVCETLAGADREDCFLGIGTSNTIFGFSNLHSQNLQSLCGGFPEETDREACTIGVVSQFIYTNLSGVYDYCENINEEDRRAICYDAAFEWSESVQDVTNDPAQICNTDQACLARYNVFMQKRSDIPDYLLGPFGTSSIE